ncbi:MAG: GYF domain-containing protein [Hyphomicrobiaceae bacterium]
MSGSNAKIEWYLARDGQQHGPLSDVELKKFIELGHLSPSDLVWRAGFPEWKTASEVFAIGQAAPPPPPPPPTQGAADPVRQAENAAGQPVGGETPGDSDRANTTDAAAARRDPQPSRPAPRSTGAAAGPTGQPGHGNTRPSQTRHDAPVRPTPQAPNAPNFKQPAPGAPRRAGPEQPAGNPASPRHPGDPAANYSPAQPGGPQAGPRPGRPVDPGAHASQTHAQPRQAGAGGSPNFTLDTGPGAGSRPGQSPGAKPGPHAQTANAAQQPPSYDDDDFYDDDDYPRARRRRPAVTALVTLVLLGMIGAGGWFAYANQATFAKIISDITADETTPPTVTNTPKAPARVAATATPKPAAAPQPSPSAPASSAPLPLLQSKFWQSFVTEYPDWAKQQESAAEQMRSDGKTDNEILVALVKSIVDWRRKRADTILSASPDYLRKLAETFVANLRFLVSQDVQACYGFISKGEISPTVLPFFTDTNHVERLGTQTNAIVAAARDGASAKRTYSEPASGDFTDLANMLIKRGWTESDLEMFSDPTKLSTAPAGKVCSLVTEWFETQLQMPAGDKQMRLLATSLQPVVRG